MKRFRDWGMLLKIMLIPIITILSVLIVSIFYFLPFTEKKLIGEKETALKHIVEVTFMLISDYHSKVGSGELSEDEARKGAMRDARALRHGNNDYVWINDLNSVILAHPEPEEEGRDMSNVRDISGKYYVNMFVEVCKKNGEGLVHYMRPRAGTLKPLPKVSYVRLFEPWGWIVGSGIYVDDVEAEMKEIRFQIISVTLLFSFIILIFTCFVAHMINRPLYEAVKVFNQIAEGDLTVDVNPGNRQDQVGMLMNAFHDMLGRLRTQTMLVRESTDAIAASIAQISTTAAQLAVSSSETSSSVTEITATAEEIRQTAYISDNEADRVAGVAKQAVRSSEKGKKAAEDAVSGMNRIKEEMEYIAESIVRLTEHTRSIGEIISVVNDLADQSDILSVNASVEAAKAGEHGRGFAVIAQEVNSLATQSKEAANQVKAILNDIYKATRAAVMAAERGSRAVETGVYLSAQSGDSIDILSQNVTESEQASVQITALSQEQLAGTEQLTLSMESISETSTQNAESARNLEIAARDLDEFGEKLRRMALVFKV
ncbi:methyl-accepting chemotaxis protein [Desulfobacterales bacterium HSG2]|nr:methyl-accepting chemotaxis protein [Desulfobacterales bacterium HSG2]